MTARLPLTPEQRRIVEWGDGPLVVIAGAGTGKTRVIVERVRTLLETRGELGWAGDQGTRPIAPEPAPRHGNPFDGPLVPEQILVLTYNVRAARELQERLDETVGPTARARITVTNFHSFCQRILTESATDAGLPPRPEVLDGVAQVLALRGLWPGLEMIYHSQWSLPGFVQFINRAKDELVSPADFDAFVDSERSIFEERYGSFEAAVQRLAAQGNLEPLREVRTAYAGVRANERAEDRGEAPTYRPDAAERMADREARRTIGGTGRALRRSQFSPADHPRIDALARTYEMDGAALEIVRLDELARIYHAYEEELDRRGTLDFGEQIAAVTQLFKTRPNVLRRWQRQFRYLLVDEFQDANVAQIELVELLGRTPDRPDNVMVVGDDDQSIYRFRGASYAAFAEFDARFARPPAHDPDAPAPGPPPRLRIEQNFRSVANVLTVANRLIERNDTRFAPDKRLATEKAEGEPIQVMVCAGPEDEAVAIADAIRALAGPDVPDGRRWNQVAVLYRKHRHREAIVARLRDEGIPYTVVGGLSLFETPEIRDLEQALRAIADPHDDAALVRTMTAGPWRLDALEILRVTRMARFHETRVVEAVERIVEAGQLVVDRVGQAVADGDAGDGTQPGAAANPPGDHAGQTQLVPVAPETRARLRQLLAAIQELSPRTWRDGPHAILQRYLERTSQVLDLVAAGSLEARRTVANIASFLRFAADWQNANPSGTVAGFVEYLDAYKSAGGELPTSVELSEDVDGVRLMTLYQAKGMEYPIVIVPSLVEGEWPVRQQGAGWFPVELLREQVPSGDIHTDEERRLLYVAVTRAQERLILTTHGGARADKGPSPFVGEILAGRGTEVLYVDRTLVEVAVGAGAAPAGEEADADAEAGSRFHLPHVEDDLASAGPGEPLEPPAPAPDDAFAAMRRVMPLPAPRERRLTLRLRAAELVSLMEAAAEDDPENPAARDALAHELTQLGHAAALSADEARRQGLDPLTFQSVALDSGASASLLQIVPLPPKFSYTAFSTYERCPLQYAFQYVYRMPQREEPVAAFAFGSTAHRAFEQFTRERRERLARGEAPPTREDLEQAFRAGWTSTDYGDRATEAGYQRRVASLLDNFWEGEVSSLGQAMAEEQRFDLVLDPGDGSPAVTVSGSIDRIDRLPGDGIEVIDYKTGKLTSQKGVDESLQLSIYALACRDVLGLGTPDLVTLYFTESAQRLSTTRTEEQLDAARTDLLDRAAQIRSGEFTATPGKDACGRCDYKAMCPERVE